jgi:dTDP-glucose 4,6-dehydratase
MDQQRQARLLKFNEKNMKRVVYVTGCLGFMGSYVARACLERGWYVRGVDKVTYAANADFDELCAYENFTFDEMDINDIQKLYECDYVINMAAETHVDNSIASSEVFLKSNINGAWHLLELIKNAKHKPTLLHFSTDEVYGDLVEGFHRETDLLKPSNPYSATKAAADQLILAWARTFDVPYVIVRPTNNYGIGQYTEKFIPKSIKALSLGRPIPLHDAGLPKRTWLHASDTAEAVITLIEAGVKNDIFNISGNYEEQNIVIAKKIIDMYYWGGCAGKYDEHLDTSIKRQGQDVRYAIDDSKIKALGWSPKAEFDIELKKIVDYYAKNFIW